MKTPDWSATPQEIEFTKKFIEGEIPYRESLLKEIEDRNDPYEMRQITVRDLILLRFAKIGLEAIQSKEEALEEARTPVSDEEIERAYEKQNYLNRRWPNRKDGGVFYAADVAAAYETGFTDGAKAFAQPSKPRLSDEQIEGICEQLVIAVAAPLSALKGGKEAAKDSFRQILKVSLNRLALGEEEK